MRGILLTSLSKSIDEGERTVTSCPLPTKSLTADGTVPSPSHEEIMKTGLPLLNLAAKLFVTACNGIVPLGATPAKDDKILKYCLSPVSGGKNESFSSYMVRETESLLCMKKDARLAAATVPHFKRILQDSSNSCYVSAIKYNVEVSNCVSTFFVNHQVPRSSKSLPVSYTHLRAHET